MGGLSPQLCPWTPLPRADRRSTAGSPVPPGYVRSRGCSTLPWRARRGALLRLAGPARPLLADVDGAPALVLAVIPLMQLWVDLGCVAEARQLARPAGPRQRAHQDLGERHAIEPLTQVQGVLLAARRERDIRPARVLTGDRPCRLTMPRQVDLRQRCVHDPSF